MSLVFHSIPVIESKLPWKEIFVHGIVAFKLASCLAINDPVTFKNEKVAFRVLESHSLAIDVIR